jgi:predicted trehalose synthase
MTILPAELGYSLPLQWFAPWMAKQRWYGSKGFRPALEQIGCLRLPSPTGVVLITHLLLDHATDKPTLYQVPLSYRSERLEEGLIGEVDGWYLHDAPHDQAFTSALLGCVVDERELDGDRASARGVRAAGAAASVGRLTSRVLKGEQSNTSIIYEGEGAPVIVKLFRVLHHGNNPDAELQTALAAAGSTAVPASIGSLVADWSDAERPAGRARGHLAFAQEFLMDAVDGWLVARAAAETDTDFTDRAFDLGVATARVHDTLAAALPTRAAHSADIATVLAQMSGRLAQAVSAVPALERHAPAIELILHQAASADWPPLQRIHGDLHLGQVLAVPERGWVFVDFEGEPLRPMEERSALDSPLRDIAGMLRSFDYVAGSLAVSGSPRDATGWAARARAAFGSGYSATAGGGIQVDGALVDAFELDKALYETVYEARNRPAWLPIPVAAIERLTARAAS